MPHWVPARDSNPANFHAQQKQWFRTGESWLPGSLPPPLINFKLGHSPDERRNSFWFQRGLAMPSVLLRPRRSPNSVSDAPPSHSDRTSSKSVRSENAEPVQRVKNAAYASQFELLPLPPACSKSAVGILQRNSAGGQVVPGPRRGARLGTE